MEHTDNPNSGFRLGSRGPKRTGLISSSYTEGDAIVRVLRPVGVPTRNKWKRWYKSRKLK